MTRITTDHRVSLDRRIFDKFLEDMAHDEGALMQYHQIKITDVAFDVNNEVINFTFDLTNRLDS